MPADTQCVVCSKPAQYWLSKLDDASDYKPFCNHHSPSDRIKAADGASTVVKTPTVEHRFELLSFTPPPSRDIQFSVPNSKRWELWVDLLQEHPNEWAVLPLTPSDKISTITRNLREVAGIETVTEDGKLYARFRQASPALSATPLPSAPAATPLPHPVSANTPAERMARILPDVKVPTGLMAPAITPLDPDTGLDALLDNPPGPIMGE